MLQFIPTKIINFKKNKLYYCNYINDCHHFFMVLYIILKNVDKSDYINCDSRCTQNSFKILHIFLVNFLFIIFIVFIQNIN